MLKKHVFLICLALIISSVFSFSSAEKEITIEQIASAGNQGVLLAKEGNLTGALIAFTKALEMSAQINDTHGRGLAMANIGKIYFINADYEASRVYFEKAVDIFYDTNDKKNEALFSANLAETYVRLLNWEDAKNYATRSIKIYSSFNNYDAIAEVKLIFGDIYYGQANLEMDWGNFNESLYHFKLAEQEYLKGNSTSQGKLSYLYCLMKEGDLYSRFHNSEEAIKKFTESNLLLEELITQNESLNDLRGIKMLIIAKENFERGILETKNLNFNLSSYYFYSAELSFKEALNSGTFKDREELIKGYFYYSSSNKNYFLFMVNGDTNLRSLANDQINLARDSFINAGFEDLARRILEDKLVNFPNEFVNSKDNNILLSGVSFYNLSYDPKVNINQRAKINFLMKYRYEIPNSEKQKLKFCCNEFCSEWIDIINSNTTEAKIEVTSPFPKEIDCDILAYGEKNPDVPLGTIEKYYQWRFVDIKIDKNRALNFYIDDYQKVKIKITNPLYIRIFNFLKLPQTLISSVISIFTIWALRKKIKDFLLTRWNIIKKRIKLSVK